MNTQGQNLPMTTTRENQMTARGFPKEWRVIIEQEIRAEKMPMAVMMDRNLRGKVHQVRRRIWVRLHTELGVIPYRSALRFGFHHTTVLYSLRKLGRQK